MTLRSWIKRSHKEPPGNPAGGTGRALSRSLGILLNLIVFLSIAVPGIAAVLPGTPIENTASAKYSLTPGGTTREVFSNTIAHVVAPLPTPATAAFMRYQPGGTGTMPYFVGTTRYSNNGRDDGVFANLTAPVIYPDNTPIDLSVNVDLQETDLYLSGDPLFLKLRDLDQNRFFDQIETVMVTVISSTGDTEVLILRESEPNSGVFVGYIQSSRLASPHGDGALFVMQDGTIDLRYVDNDDPTDLASADALFDPMGVVFNSQTGGLVNDVTVSIIEAATGLPATVYGDDGISRFPSTVTTGGTVTDDGGNVYNFPTGSYRFPLMNSGDYQLIITPPQGYSAPSEVPENELQALPGAPWAIDNDGSRGRAFTLPPLPIFRVDIPIDPASGGLWIQKTAVKKEASIGDFVPYKVQVTNTSSHSVATDLQLQDYMPRGFRYIQGSGQLNDQRITPEISPDGRTLLFNLGSLSAGQEANITYVTEVTSGTPTGKAINSAVAFSGDIRSNITNASVRIKDVFMRNASLLAGRVMTGSCQEPEQELQGVEGVRIYLEDGTYVVTDEQGRYHIEGVEPGTHVVQLDLESYQDKYEVETCEDSTQFAGVGWSQFVDIQPGTLWRANFHLRELRPEQGKPGEIDTGISQGSLELALRTSLQEGNLVNLDLPLKVNRSAAENVRLSVILPPGSEYLAGSSTLNGDGAADPDQMAVVLNYRIGDIAADSEQLLSLKVRLPENVKGDEIPFRALATIDTRDQKNLRTQPITSVLKRNTGHFLKLPEITLRPEFPSFGTELSIEDRQKFDDMATQLKGMLIEQVVLTGHTDNQPIAKRSQHIYADNNALSIGRAESVAAYLSSTLDIPEENMLISGAGELAPLATNATEEGRARNRRVEMRLIAVKPSDEATAVNAEAVADPLTFNVGEKSTGSESTTTELTGKDLRSAILAENYVNEISSGYEWLWPPATYYPPIPSIKVAVKHDPQHKVRLNINNQDVSPLNYEGAKQSKQKTVSMSYWSGVDLIDGDNHLQIAVFDPSGTLVREETRIIHHSMPPVEAILLPEESTLVADTRMPSIVAVKLLDREGHPARAAIIGEFSIKPPYSADKQHMQDSKLEQQDHKARFVVGDNGVTKLAIAPTSKTGEAEIVLNLADGKKTIKAWLKPAPRDWILVGFAEGTVGYNTFSGNQVSLQEAGIDEHFYNDGEVKFFAKGAIKGEWLLTMAYDSDKPDLDGDTLRQEIDPDTYYPLYGDGTKQGYEAASASDIYIKLERDQFYALFGDMETGLTQTELSRYSRSMNGIKSEKQGETFSYTLFAAETKQAFAKDEIRGDGTSGRYYLSADELVINSEEIVIEVRDRFHSERIIESRSLARHTDYDIDYDAGSLFFKEPIPSKDENFNPVFIVARYETEDSKDDNFNYGGRAAVKLLDKKVEVGASYIHEERGAGEGDLYGADAEIKLTEKTTLNLEAATTETKLYNEEKDADAYLAELEHDGDKVKSMAYFREQQESFGIGQQNGSETGTRKYGAEGAYKITETLQATAQAYHEDNLSTNAERDVAEFDARYNANNYSLRTGIREARDSFSNGEEQRSTQWLAGASWLTMDRKLNLRADYEQSLNGKDENSDFPTLLTLGADYRITEKVSVFTEQEFSWGAKQNSEGTRAGIKSTPWNGADVSTSIERQFNENGERVNAIFGLTQNWQMNERWSFYFSIDRSQTVKEPGNDRFNTNVPATHGSDDDFTSLSAGATYRKEKWAWWNKLETRQADKEDKYGASTSVVFEPQDGVAVSAKALAFIAKSTNGSRKVDGNLRLGMAYRPSKSRWIVLNRLDFYFENVDHSSNDYDNWRIVNNMHANFRLSRRAQMSFYYGLKYVRDTYNGITYSGFTDLIAVEARYNITKRWDVGVHGSMLHSWNSNNFDYSLGADVGYSPMTNTWVSLGYNMIGFEDDDFSAANYTAQGAYMRFRAKFDQQSVRDAAEWLNK